MVVVKKWFGTWVAPSEGMPSDGQQVLIQVQDSDTLEVGYFRKKMDGYSYPVFECPRGWIVSASLVVAWIKIPPVLEDEEQDAYGVRQDISKKYGEESSHV